MKVDWTKNVAKDVDGVEVGMLGFCTPVPGVEVDAPRDGCTPLAWALIFAERCNGTSVDMAMTLLTEAFQGISSECS